MTKYELIFKTIKDSYNLALTRRENIRNRINIFASFGFGIITLFIASIFEKLNANSALLTEENIYLCCLEAVAFIAFVVTYVFSFGIKTIKDFDPEKQYLDLMNLVNDNANMQNTFYDQYDYFVKNNLEFPALLAENDAIYSYLSNMYAKQTNYLYDKNKNLTIDFYCMIAAIFLNVILLMIMRAVV